MHSNHFQTQKTFNGITWYGTKDEAHELRVYTSCPWLREIIENDHAGYFVKLNGTDVPITFDLYLQIRDAYMEQNGLSIINNTIIIDYRQA